MKFLRYALLAGVICALAACGTPSTKNIFGKQKKRGPGLASSTAPLVVPNNLNQGKIIEFYPASKDVSRRQPTVSLVPPGSNLQRFNAK